MKNISKRKEQAIKEALHIWKNQNRYRCSFAQKMKLVGWKPNDSWDNGSFKKCLLKDSIVIKYLNRPYTSERINEIRREVEQFRVAPAGLKKHLPKIYEFSENFIIQDRVLLACWEYGGKCNAERIACKYELEDCYHNHGHSLNGTVKFFDWVFRRDDPWIYDYDKPLLDDSYEEEY